MAPRREGNVLNWASELDDAALEQANRAAALPFVAGHVALMPDAHVGIGATVGSVIATDGAVIPSAVGVDLGCGMIAVETDLTSHAVGDNLDALHRGIAAAVPAGTGKGHTRVDVDVFELLGRPVGTELSDRDANRARTQYGTLGSGNHFVEVCLDERDVVWVVLHSGSRGIGNQLASRHIETAKGVMKRYFIDLDDPALAYLVEGTAEFDAYIADMLWAQEYAMVNRERMMDLTLAEVFTHLGGNEISRVNCFAGETEVITRKGTRPIEELAGGCHELLTDNGEWVKAPVQSFGRAEVWAITLSRSGVLKTIRATADHRWLARTRRDQPYETTTAELTAGERLRESFPQPPKGLKLDPLACARGFVFGDGSRTGGRTLANFCGAKDTVLLPLFETLGNPPRQYGPVTRVTGLPGDWKDLPPLESDPSYLYSWLAGYFAADGDVDKTGRPTLASAKLAHLEFVRTACQMVGIGTFGIRMRMRSGFGKEPSALYLVGLMRGNIASEFFLLPEHRRRFETGQKAAERRGWNVVSATPTGETTEVYCAVVEGTHSFALADNILTGNCHHNFCEREHHMGRNVWVTRKGAIRARRGDRGVIPGSMGTRSYIVSGLGSQASYTSCSHGAGRRLSRGQARRELDVEGLVGAMEGKAWNAGSAEALLDEDPRAYKPIDQVMDDQKDLVAVEHTLSQILNYKGVEQRPQRRRR